MIILSILIMLTVALPGSAQTPPVGILTEIGIDQRLNEPIPASLVFRDETGRQVRIGDFYKGRPILLSLVYYECPMLCSMALNGLVKSLRGMSFDVGREFDVLTISFDPSETSALAASKRAVYLKLYGRDNADAGWHFLTGDEESIRILTESAGFRYKRDPYTNQWAHVSAIIVLTSAGRISQYLYGIEYSARDLRLSVVQASQNRIGSVVDSVLLYCYHYDPATGKYGLAIMTTLRITGCATVMALGVFIFLGLRRDTTAVHRG
jgi:protein SCO1/2